MELSPFGNKREDIILVVCRIDPLKKIENAIKLAKSLKESNIGKGMVIIGSLDHYDYGYYNQLKKMIIELDLSDYISIETDVNLNGLIEYMGISKIYFHSKPGEHFGISIVEAMSAGLIPIVYDIGGQTEFVPSKYQYHTLEQAVKIVKSAFKASNSERVHLSDSVKKFSSSNYKKHFKQIVKELLNCKKIISTEKIDSN